MGTRLTSSYVKNGHLKTRLQNILYVICWYASRPFDICLNFIILLLDGLSKTEVIINVNEIIIINKKENLGRLVPFIIVTTWVSRRLDLGRNVTHADVSVFGRTITRWPPDDRPRIVPQTWQNAHQNCSVCNGILGLWKSWACWGLGAVRTDTDWPAPNGLSSDRIRLGSSVQNGGLYLSRRTTPKDNRFSEFSQTESGWN